MELTADLFRAPEANADRIARSTEKLKAILSGSPVVTPELRAFLEGRPAPALHRRMLAQQLYEASFSSGKEVIYLSIMSGKTTLAKMPDRICRAKDSHTTINVLTWDPAIGPAAMNAFGNHLNEEPTVLAQTHEAHNTWQRLASENPGTIKKAGKYVSSPTMQGLVVLGDWAQVEMIPYRTPPGERLSVFLTAEYDTEVFAMFQSSFQRLLADSTPL